MTIGFNYGPRATTLGPIISDSAANEERFRRLMATTDQAIAGRQAAADIADKEGRLELERDRFEFEKPLREKQVNIQEAAAWLEKTISYFRAKADAMQQRLADRAQWLESQAVIPVQTSRSTSVSASGPGGGTSGSFSESIPIAVRKYGGEIEPPGFEERVVDNPYARQWLGQSPVIKQRTRIPPQAIGGVDFGTLGEIEDRYQASLQEIDNRFGIADGWIPNLFA